MSNYTNGGGGDKTYRGDSKNNKDSNQKFNISDIIKSKDATGKPKTGSRKMLNDSGLSYGSSQKPVANATLNGK